jgi:alpha-mannosidase
MLVCAHAGGRAKTIPLDGCTKKGFPISVPNLKNNMTHHFACSLCALGLGYFAVGGAVAGEAKARPDLTREPTLYVVGYAHLDTQWRWEYPQVIQEYLAKTMLNNFALIEKYPHYVFNFSGAYRYQLMKEYYPENYQQLKGYVAAGRWFPCGSSVDENDVNGPSAEAIIRQVLYGNDYFRHDFGVASEEFILPDCFGFPASLPSILAHAGVKGFSTQKLSWGGAPLVGGTNSPENTPVGTPFNVGLWEGPDGKTVIAALNPGAYGGLVTSDLSQSPPPATNEFTEGFARRGGRGGAVDWPRRIQLNGEVSGIYADYHYYGTGDTGGSPTEYSVKMVEALVTKGTIALPAGGGRGRRGGPNDPNGPGRPVGPAGDSASNEPATNPAPVQVGLGPVRVVSAKADQMFLDILDAQPDFARFPHYKGDLELINHSAGSLTSQAYHRRWNRMKELLGDATEKASVAAMWLGGQPYPQERLNRAWMLLLGGQMHDILPGTATPKAYEFAWNDDVLVMNQFADMLGSATASVASGLDTRTKGTALVVYNPLNVDREDVVEATVRLPVGTTAVRVTGPDNQPVPAQLQDGRVLFVAKTPSVGYAVYDVQPATSVAGSELKVTESSLENARYRVQLDANGDVASIFDKAVHQELLSAPLRLAISTDNPEAWPAWNMDWDQETNAPRSFVSGPARVRVTENGPARVAVEVARETEGSTFVQTVRLAAGDAGNRVEFANVIDWKSTNCNLKAIFALSATNLNATYNWDIGTIERPTENERQFEVASHQWVDLTDAGGAYGATVLTDCKLGSDKRDDHTLRLTLLRTPGTRGGYEDQASQDLGRHEIVFGLAGHAGDWRQGGTDWQGQRLNQPLIAFESSQHAGALGRELSLLKLNNPRVRVLAMKKAEHSDEIIIRLVELDGHAQPNVRVALAGPITAAREVNGQEQPVGQATVIQGALETDFTPCQPRTFAVKLGAAPAPVKAIKSQSVALAFDRSVSSLHGKESLIGFDNLGRALPGELLPEELAYDGIRFHLGPVKSGKFNAVTPQGQTIKLPGGQFNRVYLLAASAQGDQRATFRIDGQAVPLTIQDWSGFLGQWDNRLWSTIEELAPADGRDGRGGRVRTITEYSGLIPGYIKRTPVAWFASHHHLADGSTVPYSYAYLYAYPIDVPVGARTLTLPNNNNIRVMAVTVAQESGTLTPAQPLYDTLERTPLE